ncbi:uridylate kinase [Brevinema andersonii]|uniref:Uridylate kinase n=1 Tax=Brevinema andersonii TaxID=34097 RepID=A0A1I1D358_BREAD|nr:uridine monophosphate kinase [Brevinema andersonii]SFB69351.1 uridylate kinase [Brevinema andersonii]
MMYDRVLIKISGEILGDGAGMCLAAENMHSVCAHLETVNRLGVQAGIVVGAGNVMRGATSQFLDRVRADSIGMLGTVVNALALQNVLFRDFQVQSVICGSFPIEGMVAKLDPDQIQDAFSKNKLILFAGGTGAPFFSTDTAGVLKALEINANLMIKATKVDGVYDKDPLKFADAKRYETISYEEILEKKLNVMDWTATSLAMEHKLPIRVTDIFQDGQLSSIIAGQSVGTLVS